MQGSLYGEISKLSTAFLVVHYNGGYCDARNYVMEYYKLKEITIM